MVPVQVQRRLRDEEQGPITPGMGAYAPCTTFGEKVITEAVERIIDPLILALANGGTPFTGVLHLNLSIDAQHKPRVLGIGSTMGDMESQVLLPLLDEDLFEIFWAVTEGDLAHFLEAGFRFSPYHCLALSISRQGHASPETAPVHISGLAELEKHDLMTIEKQVLEKARPIAITVRPLIFHEGGGAQANSFNISGEPGRAAAGARILTLSVIGESLLDAKVAAYELAGRIECEGKHYRRDIGDRGLE
jgi:phosphoribosylamine--glycine ligase